MRAPILLLLTLILAVPAGASNRMLTTEFEVRAPIEKAWQAWTTPDGIRTFFAPDCRVELRVDGAYEITSRRKPSRANGAVMPRWLV